MAQVPAITNWQHPVAFGITRAADVNRATDAARSWAAEIGFTASEAEGVALAVSELASNLVRHAGGGSISLKTLLAGERKGIQIESEDSGPGIGDVELALTDGYSTAGGLGNGLGAVNRLMDDLQFHQLRVGLRVVCRRWVRPSTKNVLARGLECSAATRAVRLAPENGDAFVIQQWEENALVGVIDGLGHGPSAQKAAQIARAYVEQHFDQPLVNLFRGVGRACIATRGVVMALGKFDLSKQSVALASVGNVEVRMFSGTNHFHLVARRGVLGLNAPSPLIVEHPWTAESLLIMHSDGVLSRWRWEDYIELAHQQPAIIARRLLHRLARKEDDATIVVARNSSV